MEIYKVIKSFRNYSVSNLGNVKNNKTGKILKPQINGLQGNQYKTVTLCEDGLKECWKIHKLVAEAFIPNPLNKKSVDHIDNNRFNNVVDNLRWATQSENGMNKSMHSNSTTGVKGVHYYKPLNKWVAHICVNRLRRHIGYFETKEEATKARQAKANQLFGVYVNAVEKIKTELELLEDELNAL
jgi:hypothetical protein